MAVFPTRLIVMSGEVMNSLRVRKRFLGSVMARRKARDERRGMSVLQFVSCLVALSVGVWLGASYVGLDLKKTAETALVESQILDKVPEDWRPVQAVKEQLPTQEELAAQAQQELASLEGQIAALEVGSETAAPSVAADADALDETERTATIAYWAELQKVVGKQSELQLDAEQAATDVSATKLAAVKSRISRYAADAIRAIPKSDVDASAVAIGRELAHWYEQGANVLNQAVQVWEATNPGPNGSQLTKDWERAQTQQTNEGRLLVGRLAAVRDSLTRRFGEGFAPITGI
jgi:hypothetical protein